MPLYDVNKIDTDFRRSKQRAFEIGKSILSLRLEIIAEADKEIAKAKEKALQELQQKEDYWNTRATQLDRKRFRLLFAPHTLKKGR